MGGAPVLSFKKRSSGMANFQCTSPIPGEVGPIATTQAAIVASRLVDPKWFYSSNSNR